MTVYELWFEDESNTQTYSFFPQNNDSARELLSPVARLIWRTEAESIDAACSARNEFLGWEAYKPWAH